MFFMIFTGMIVSELNEALLYQVKTTQEELNRENVKLARRLRALIDERIPLSEIPKRMLAMDDVHSPLTTFNYKNYFFNIVFLRKVSDFFYNFRSDSCIIHFINHIASIA